MKYSNDRMNIQERLLVHIKNVTHNTLRWQPYYVSQLLASEQSETGGGGVFIQVASIYMYTQFEREVALDMMVMGFWCTQGRLWLCMCMRVRARACIGNMCPVLLGLGWHCTVCVCMVCSWRTRLLPRKAIISVGYTFAACSGRA